MVYEHTIDVYLPRIPMMVMGWDDAILQEHSEVRGVFIFKMKGVLLIRCVECNAHSMLLDEVF